MRKILRWMVIFCALPMVAAEHLGIYEHGTVVRMRTGDCMHRSFMATMSGAQPVPPSAEICPEYTLVSDKVVFVIVGRSSSQLIPLADVIDFRIQKGEIAVRLDDARRERKFSIKEMILRSEWDRVERHIDEQLKASEIQEAQR